MKMVKKKKKMVKLKKKKNKFVVFEGLDRSGKSTQAKILAEARGAIYTKQPGDHHSTEALKDILLNKDSQISDFVEALIFSVDRSIHTEKVLLPALKAGRDVVCDRFVGSFLAYQGYGRGGDLDFLKDISQRATGGLEPDLVIFMDNSKTFHYPSEADDRIEQESQKFKNRVHGGYMKLLEQNPDTWVLVDAAGTKEEVAKKINAILAEKLDWKS